MIALSIDEEMYIQIGFESKVHLMLVMGCTT